MRIAELSETSTSPTFGRRGLALAGLGGLAATVAGCGTGPKSAGSANGKSVGDAAPTSTEPAPSSVTTGTGRSGVLLAVFSRAGENYWNGGRRMLREGNTTVVAGIIAKLTALDTYRIEAADPYPTAYEPTVQRNVREMEADARPVIATPVPDLQRYHTVLLASPVWASQEPMIMRTFIDSVDLTGKTVLPVVTYAVSQMGNVADDYTELIPDATIGRGLAIRGEEARGSESAIRTWLLGAGLG